MLEYKYRRVELGREVCGSRCLVWWKDINSLQGEDLGMPSSWISKNLFRKVGDGKETSLWKDIWMVPEPLSIKYPRLFSLVVDKEVNVRGM